MYIQQIIWKILRTWNQEYFKNTFIVLKIDRKNKLPKGDNSDDMMKNRV